MSSLNKSHKILVGMGYSVCYHKHLRNSTEELWNVSKTVNMRDIRIRGISSTSSGHSCYG